MSLHIDTDLTERGVAPEYFIRNQERFSRYEEAAICRLKERVHGELGLTPGADYHIPLMRIENEMKKIEQLWEKEEPETVVDGGTRRMPLKLVTEAWRRCAGPRP